MAKKVITEIGADWKDTEHLIEGFKEAIKKLGGFVYDHPSYEGSDSYGFLVSDKKLTKKEIQEFDFVESDGV